MMTCKKELNVVQTPLMIPRSVWGLITGIHNSYNAKKFVYVNMGEEKIWQKRKQKLPRRELIIVNDVDLANTDNRVNTPNLNS